MFYGLPHGKKYNVLPDGYPPQQNQLIYILSKRSLEFQQQAHSMAAS
jgi:hypothetical protein